jgi:TPR repeat protein
MARTPNVPCAFCRTLRPSNPREFVDRLRVRVEKYNDAQAMNSLGDSYRDGLHGVEIDRAKAMELYRRSYECKSPEAADRLSYYSTGSAKREYMKEGARRGHINQSLELGVSGLNYGTVDKEYAVRLIVRAASAGDEEAMGICWKMFQAGLLLKKDLESTIRAKQAALEEVNNEDRAFPMRFHAYCNSI